MSRPTGHLLIGGHPCPYYTEWRRRADREGTYALHHVHTPTGVRQMIDAEIAPLRAPSPEADAPTHTAEICVEWDGPNGHYDARRTRFTVTIVAASDEDAYAQARAIADAVPTPGRTAGKRCESYVSPLPAPEASFAVAEVVDRGPIHGTFRLTLAAPEAAGDIHAGA